MNQDELDRIAALYEVTNGYIGESYVRVYVWAISEAQALELAQQSFKSAHPNNRSDYSEDLTAKLLFKSDSAPFATRPSDDGWRDRTVTPTVIFSHNPMTDEARDAIGDMLSDETANGAAEGHESE